MKIWHKESYGVPMWGPSIKSKNLLATGSNNKSEEGRGHAAQNFLRINELNDEEGIKTIGCSISPAPFTALHWVDTFDDYGIIAGGMQDGFITLWSPKSVLESYASLNANGGDITQQKPALGCVSASQVHMNTPVRTLEFNPIKKNLLASGGSEVFIQDIS